MAGKSIWLAQFSLCMEKENKHCKKKNKKKINTSPTFRASRLEHW